MKVKLRLFNDFDRCSLAAKLLELALHEQGQHLAHSVPRVDEIDRHCRIVGAVEYQLEALPGGRDGELPAEIRSVPLLDRLKERAVLALLSMCRRQDLGRLSADN